MERPPLNKLPFEERIPEDARILMTMDEGQWDQLLQSAYDHGILLIEMCSCHGIPCAYYQRRLNG